MHLKGSCFLDHVINSYISGLSFLDAVKGGGLLRCPNYKNDVNYVHSQWGVD